MFEFLIAPLIIFIVGFIYLRFAGKKAVSEMNSFDLLFVLIVGNIISNPLEQEGITAALVLGVVFTLIYIGFSLLTLNNRFKWFLVASPTVLVRNGDIDEKGLRKTRMTTEELLGKIREKGFTKTADIELAIMEDMGTVSVIPKSHVRALQPGDIQLQPSPTFIPIPLIINGQILDHNLKYLNKDYVWLDNQLKAWQKNIDDISDITLASLNQKGYLEVDTDNPENNGKSPYEYKPGNQN